MISTFRSLLVALALVAGTAAAQAHAPAPATDAALHAAASSPAHDPHASSAPANAGHITASQPHHAEAPHYAPNIPLIRTVLLATLWLFIAAILLGPLVKVFIGDLWQRRTAQPFTDDPGHSSSHASHSHGASHH